VKTYVVRVETEDGHQSGDVIGPFDTRADAERWADDPRVYRPVDGGYVSLTFVNRKTAEDPEAWRNNQEEDA
jgi:hypothetical protein